ncbi:NAD-dependent protein deacylase [Solibacillus sp. R5-41]|uniref:NAD-dependent deacylase n=1 Tax=Solibacillus sp. R5-41 TaxID=2048654 RepID=UPI000C127E23|nr:NAD-dependent deacylase [Solibacillus sp. R5-41]ATP40632.1 NAD-dependent protein deacylase [Solibacillus sp. R5-41]
MTTSTLAKWMLQSNSTVILTGAGMSTESGIPDFRSRTGWWKNIDPRTVASVESLQQNYELFREFYQMRILSLTNCEPHSGHEILANWEARGLLTLIATQNVDRFHQQAGNGAVAELHGNIVTIRCQTCGKALPLGHFMDNAVCTYCNGKLRPNVVLFGEALPQQAWNRSLHAIQNADVVIVIGTSLEVYPVNQLPAMCQGRLVYINLDVSGNSRNFDLILQGTAGGVLAEIDKYLRELIAE